MLHDSFIQQSVIDTVVDVMNEWFNISIQELQNIMEILC